MVNGHKSAAHTDSPDGGTVEVCTVSVLLVVVVVDGDDDVDDDDCHRSG